MYPEFTVVRASSPGRASFCSAAAISAVFFSSDRREKSSLFRNSSSFNLRVKRIRFSVLGESQRSSESHRNSVEHEQVVEKEN